MIVDYFENVTQLYTPNKDSSMTALALWEIFSRAMLELAKRSGRGHKHDLDFMLPNLPEYASEH